MVDWAQNTDYITFCACDVITESHHGVKEYFNMFGFKKLRIVFDTRKGFYRLARQNTPSSRYVPTGAFNQIVVVSMCPMFCTWLGF